MTNNSEHKKLIDELTLLRRSLPYDDHDPFKNRELAIAQIVAIRSHLVSLGITPNILSPLSNILHALEGLEVGRKSILLKPMPVKFSDRDRMLFTMAAVAFDFLKNSEKIPSKDAAKKILKIIEKYEFPNFRGRNDTERNLTDQISDSAHLMEWAKGCRNGRKGKAAQKQYLNAMLSLEENLQSCNGSPTDIVEKYFDIFCFGDTDPYRVK